MNKTKHERLSALQKINYDYLVKAFEKGEYEVVLEEKMFQYDGYADGYLVICGSSFKCSFNKNGFVCWLCDIFFSQIFSIIPGLEMTIHKQAVEIITNEKENYKKNRIAELEEELKNLKGE